MNTLTRLIAGLVTAAVAVFLLFFLTTVGLIVALVAGVALFVGALSLRGKGNETRVGGFRVITFGSQPFGSQPFGDKMSGEQPFRQIDQQAPQSKPRKEQDDVVDLSPEDYKAVANPDDRQTPPKN